MDIEIRGITPKQKEMLSVIWQCETDEQFLEWFVTLSFNDKRMVEGLLELIRLEYLEEALKLNDMSEAMSVIENVRRK